MENRVFAQNPLGSRPDIALALMGAVIIFAPLLEGGTTHVAAMIIRLLIVCLLALFLIIGIRKGSLEVPVLPTGRMTFMFVGLAALSTVISPYYHPSLQWLFMLVSYVAFCYLVVSFVRRWEAFCTIAAMMVCVGIGEAVWTIYDGFAANTLRPSGTFFNPNFLAGYLAVSWAMLLSGLVYRQRIRMTAPFFTIRLTRKVLLQIGNVLMLAIVLAAVLLTESRAGIFVCFLSTLVVLIARFGYKVAGGCGILLIVAALLIPTPTRERIVAEHSHNAYSYSRWHMWESAVQQMMEHPLGVGLGLYQYTYSQYAFPVEGQIARYGKVAQTPHNDYLQMGIEMGPASMVVFLLGLIALARETRTLLHRRLSRRQRSLIVGLTAGGMALLVHAGLDSNLRVPSIAIELVLCSALILSASRFTATIRNPVRVLQVHSRLIWGGVGCGLLLLVTAETLRLGLAWTYFESASRQIVEGRTAPAIDSLRKAIALDPGKALYHQWLGTVHAKTFDVTGEEQLFNTARNEFQQAIDLNPLDGRLPALMAQLYFSAGSMSGSSVSSEQKSVWLQFARESYDQAIRLMPYFAVYRYEQARLYLTLGDRVQAERRAKEAEALEPNFLPARALLARMWLQAGERDGASREIREIRERQQLYRHWAKNALEHGFLDVDVSNILGEKTTAG
jgi:tetratricopeptide (TPR) repeat protein